MATIVLTGGGSAGHCTPHLALLPYLKKDFDKIYYIGSENGIERKIISKTKIPYYSVPCAKLNRSFTVKNFAIPFSVVSGIIKSGHILDELKPDVIFSKGGYVSVPTVIAAKKRKIPIIAHESDYTIGLANKITSKYCKLVLTSFPSTAKELKNGEFVGSPIRSYDIKPKSKALDFFHFSGRRPIVLVMGGSLGATAINSAVRQSLEYLITKYDIIHICGKGNLDKSIKNDHYFQAEYLDNIFDAMSICSVCVSRAGSNSIFELLNNKIPCVLIPLPKGASRGDQILNASFFQKKGLAYVLPQEVLSKESLIFAINSTYENRNNLEDNFSTTPINDASREISRILADCILH